MYWNKWLGITTLSCKVESMRLRPEWPWRARRYKITPDESVQYSYLVSSSSCHAFLPLFVRPMMTMQEICLMIVFDSPEFSRSIVFSMWSSMTKNMNQFLWYFIIEDWIFSWFDIGPNSFPNRYSSCGRTGRFSSLWFRFGLWSACKITRIQFQRTIFELHFWGFLLIVVQIRDQLVWAMRNSDPGVRILCSRTQFWTQLHICRASNKLQLPIRAQFWCSLGANLLLPMLLRLLARCTHDRPLNLWIVRILQCLSSWNTVRFQQHSEILHPYKIYSVCLVVITFQFILHIFATEILYVQDHHYSKALLSCSRLVRMRNSIVLSQRVSPFYRERILFLHTHFCDCPGKTELIYRNNCAKKSFNRSHNGTIVSNNLPPPLLLSTPLDNGLAARKTGCPLSPNSNIIFSAILSHSPCGLSALIEYHFFSEPRPRNDHCPAPNLFAYRETSRALDSHSFLLSSDPHEMSLNIDMKMIRPVNFSGVTLTLNSYSWNLWLSCNVVNPGKIFNSNSIGSP